MNCFFRRDWNGLIQARTIPLFIMILVLSSCALPRNQYTEIAKGRDWQVRLIKFASKSGVAGQGGFEHPVDISLAKLGNMLAAVRYESDTFFSGQETKKVFPRRIRNVILKPIHDALSKAGPDQVVDFSFTSREDLLGIFSTEKFTSGILFKKDGKIHLAMRAVNYKIDNHSEAIGQFSGDPTKACIYRDWKLVPGPGMTLMENPKKSRFAAEYFYNWLIIDPDYDFPRPYVKRYRRAKPGAMLPEGAKPVYQTTPSMPAHGPGSGFGLPDIGVTPADTVDDPAVREQLDILRELYNEGAISRSTYERRRNELLNR